VSRQSRTASDVDISYCKCNAPRTLLHEGGLGTMGFVSCSRVRDGMITNLMVSEIWFYSDNIQELQLCLIIIFL
jgi:hypothetical protein